MLALPFKDGSADGLTELRRRAADAAHARRFGDPAPEWSTVGDEWTGQTAGRDLFTVRSESGSAIVREEGVAVQAPVSA